MNFFREWGQFMMMGARAHAKWELNISNTIVGDKKRMIILGLLPLYWGRKTGPSARC